MVPRGFVLCAMCCKTLKGDALAYELVPCRVSRIGEVYDVQPALYYVHRQCVERYLSLDLLNAFVRKPPAPPVEE